jgi:hypothetical protein
MRIVTRGDLDGLVASVLLTTMEDVDKIELVHPQHITDSLFVVKKGDILAKMPYHPGCHMWFSHRQITESNQRPPEHFRGAHAIAPSVSRVIFDHYDSGELGHFSSLVEGADRFESASLSPEDVSAPSGMILLGFLIDPRTSFGPFKVFFKSLVKRLKEMDIDEVLRETDVAARVTLYLEQQAAFKDALLKHSRVDEGVVITDFRSLESVPIGNRFMVYSLFPDCNVSVRLQWGPEKKFVAATIGRSIFNRSSTTNIGNLCSDYGGGGHEGAGSSPLEPETAEEMVQEMVALLNEGVD